MKISLRQVVVCEGKYDKIRLASVLDTLILETGGFSIFKDKSKQQLLKHLGRTRGLLLFTDSDKAGFQIRRFITDFVGKEYVQQVYIPDVFGKEKRKHTPSKEGKIGVEGINTALLLECLEKAGITAQEKDIPTRKAKLVTKIDLYEAGLSGGENSRQKRWWLLKQLNLPQRISQNTLLEIINTSMDYQQYQQLVKSIPNNFNY